MPYLVLIPGITYRTYHTIPRSAVRPRNTTSTSYMTGNHEKTMISGRRGERANTKHMAIVSSSPQQYPYPSGRLFSALFFVHVRFHARNQLCSVCMLAGYIQVPGYSHYPGTCGTDSVVHLFILSEVYDLFQLLCVLSSVSFCFHPEVIFRSRVIGACPVTTGCLVSMS